jgi:hypothetical protein
MCHTYFFTFIGTTDFKARESEKFCLTASLVLKRYFLSNSFALQSKLSLTISDINKKNVTEEGGRKSAKKSVTYYLNGQ